MDRKELKKKLAGFGLAGLLAGAGMVVAPVVSAASG